MNRKAVYALVISTILAISLFALLPINMGEAHRGPHSKTDFHRKISDSFIERSSSHDARGHGSHQAVYLVYPHKDYIFTGMATFTATKGVDVLVYHDVTGSNLTKGLTIHNVTGRSYAVTTLMSNVTSGTIEFVGAAVLIHSPESAKYTVVASVDAFARQNQSVLLAQQ